ncbi:MAG TPA: MarR family transcriptional regulator [Anaerolineales bacterium]|nr:MarR family transcriptional regulator [Anaerolineales bacterium]
MTRSVQFSQAIRSWMDVFMHRSMRGWGLFAKSTGLSMPQFSVLMQLHYRGACGMSEISERFEVTAAAASQLVDKLVQSGFIKREEDPHDRRAKLLNLTDRGKELIQRGIEERYRWVDQLAERLTVEERVQVSEALNIMTRAAQELEAELVQPVA